MGKELFYTIKIGGQDVAIQRATDLRLAIKEINDQLKITEDNDAYDELEKELLKAKAALKDVTKEQNLAIKAFQGTRAGVGSYRDLEAQLEKSREAYRRMGKEQRENTEEAEQLRIEISKLSNELKEIDEDMDLSFRKIGDYQGEVLSALDKVIPGLGGIGDALSGIGSGGGLPGALGLGFGAFAVGEAVLEITQGVREFVVEINELRREVNAITKETGEGLEPIL